MGFTLVASTAYVAINLCVDVLYAFLNPRIRY
jgi:peptide/nickel transport system permease protein